MQEKINKLTEKNLDDVFKISKEQFKEHSWTSDQFKDCLTNKSYISYVLTIDNNVASFLIAQNQIDSINLLLIGTKNEYKKMSLATTLINKLFDNKIKIWLEVRKDNSPAINLYKKLGFKELYERKNYYKDGTSALIFEKY
ncbi:MAG: ribosomal protein S18-alanine N-acetyltransferase [Clostridia bacterium]|nr:ribosomal protein S18-alanine N-acetyltransferase [Clostridia bacterium]